ncbi:MAG: ubiquitin carboxyl-terminal hydrolase, partial [Anaerolineae bacterium]
TPIRLGDKKITASLAIQGMDGKCIKLVQPLTKDCLTEVQQRIQEVLFLFQEIAPMMGLKPEDLQGISCNSLYFKRLYLSHDYLALDQLEMIFAQSDEEETLYENTLDRIHKVARSLGKNPEEVRALDLLQACQTELLTQEGFERLPDGVNPHMVVRFNCQEEKDPACNNTPGKPVTKTSQTLDEFLAELRIKKSSKLKKPDKKEKKEKKSLKSTKTSTKTKEKRVLDYRPPGLDRQGNNCWLNSLMQLIMRFDSLREAFSYVSDETKKFTEEFIKGKQAGKDYFKSSFTGNLRKHIASRSQTIEKSCWYQEDAEEGLRAIFSNFSYPYDHPLNPGQGFYFFEEIYTNQSNQLPRYDYVFPLYLAEYAEYQEVLTMQMLMNEHFLSGGRGEDFPGKMLNYSPEEMLVHINRTDGSIVERSSGRRLGSNKLEIPIEFSDNLTMTVNKKFVVQNQRPSDDVLYNLDAFIYHNGKTINGGHYFIYLQDEVGNWWCCNDKTVKQVEPSSRYFLKHLSQSCLYHFSKAGLVQNS